ncbi:MAG TPA: sigma-70 family RNA polymerase sigma factor [Rhodanobacteraceae bacterium]|nr:sigma-70 family RNA polymerase sigma factor [Rhodanobacteraceae bacterium]
MVAHKTFDHVEKEFGPLVRRIAISYEADRWLAEDLAQDIYCALWRALPTFRGQCSLRTFVARVATNRAISHVRRTARLPRSVELAEDFANDGPTPEGNAMAQDQQLRLLAAVRSLPLSLRQVALLALEGLAIMEIADVMGISANAVAIRMSRAKGLLRDHLGDDK